MQTVLANSINDLSPCHRLMRGQAMTEFNIAAAFVLLPIFLLVPLVGKVIDIKQTAVASARYMAWERTVYFPDNNAMANDTVNKGTLPRKSYDALQNETVLREFEAGTNPIKTSPSPQILTDKDMRSFWHDYRDQPLLRAASLNNKDAYREGHRIAQSNALDTIDQIASLIQTPFRIQLAVDRWFAKQANNLSELGGVTIFDESALNNLTGEIPFVPDQEFKKDNLYSNTVSFKLANLDNSKTPGYGPESNTPFNAPFDKLSEVNISARGGILADTWSAQSAEMFQRRTEKRVPSSWLRPFFAPVQWLVSANLNPLPPISQGGIVSRCFLTGCLTSGTQSTMTLRKFSIAPELASDKFIPGYVDTNTIRGNRETPDCRFGTCSYKEKEARSNKAYDSGLLNTLLGMF
mgnify:CR=1 FL=1